MKRILAAVAPLAMLGTANAGVYKCQNITTGKITYQQQPCPGHSASQKLTVQSKSAGSWTLLRATTLGDMTEDIYFDPGATRTMGSVIRVKFKHMLSGPGEPKPDPNIHYNDYHEGQQYVVYYDCVAGLTSGIVAPQMQEDMEPKILQKDPLYLVPYQHQKHYPVITDDNIVAKVCD